MSDVGERWPRVSRAFDEATALVGTERDRYLAELAASDPEVAQEVESLLAADRQTGDLLDVAAGAARSWAEREQSTKPPDADRAGERVGAYRLLRRIGRGGMGEVWEAERADGQFERRVAVKLLKRGIDSEEVLRRFYRERQILARLEHPGITRLLDGGIADDGRPFLVMEKVDGQPLMEFIAARRLGVRQRARLLLDIAEAVDAAHRAFVVHRDLKPSNVLVTERGEAKLLDFGVAKLLDSEAAETMTSASPLTPAYAAPEQIVGGAITAATDVYALGALLFECLVGRRPFDRRSRIATELALEVERETATRPSVAARAAGGSGIPAGEIDADLDAIVLRALRSEPEQRYPSVAAFAEELRRFLDGRPVEARGGDFAYRARKFLLRHRYPVAAGLVAISALIAATAVSTRQAAKAREEATRAREVERFLTEIFERADPTESMGEQLTARQILDEAARRIVDDAGLPPATRASLEETLARSYRGLGLLEASRSLAESALERRRRHEGDTARSTDLARVTLAETLIPMGELEAGEAALRPALARLAAEREPSLDLARALFADVFLALQMGDAERATLGARRAFDIVREQRGENDPETISAEVAMADGAAIGGRLADAVKALEDALARLERAGRRGNSQTFEVTLNLADFLDLLGRSSEAERRFVEALSVGRNVLGARHPEVAQALLKYGSFLLGRRRFDEADAALHEAVSILEPLGHFDAGNGWRYLGYSALGRERWVEAEASFDKSERFLRSKVGDDHNLTWTSLAALAQARAKLGRLEEAEAMQRRAIAAFARIAGAESNEIRIPMKNLGETLRARGRVAEALDLHRRVLEIERHLFGTDDHYAVTVTKRQIALDLLAAPTPTGLEEARCYLDEAIETIRSSSEDALRLPELLETSGRLALAAGDRARAAADLADAAALWESDGEPDPASAQAVRATLAKLEKARS